MSLGRVVALALLLGGGAAAWWVQQHGGVAPPGADVAASIVPPALPAGPVQAPRPALLDPAPGAVAAASRSVAEIEQRLFVQGSLRGSALDGDWGVDAQGRLQPSRALRRRFDQLLSTLGEVGVDELGRWLQARARAELRAEAADEVMLVWERYLQLQRRSYRWGLDGRDSNGWQAALAERQTARREILGRAWADAFYADEEEALRRTMAARESRSATRDEAGAAAAAGVAVLPELARAPAAGVDAQQLFEQRRQALGLAAAQRLAAEDAAQADWEARLAAARAELVRLRQAAELSPPQRQQAADDWIAAHFSAGGEQLRARALLGL